MIIDYIGLATYENNEKINDVENNIVETLLSNKEMERKKDIDKNCIYQISYLNNCLILFFAISLLFSLLILFYVICL
jgi:hypothetical protein